MTYRIGTQGHYTLPAITLKWWDASSQQTRTTEVPAVTVAAAANIAYRPVFSITEDLKKLGQPHRLHLSGFAFSLLALLLGVALIVWFARPFIRRAYLARHAAWLESADYAWRQIPSQLEGKPPQLGAVYLWTRRSHKGLKLTGFGPRLQALLRACYGREPSNDHALLQLKDS